ncbi:replication-relaxation family protein [Streptomyces sp. NPDC004031]
MSPEAALAPAGRRGLSRLAEDVVPVLYQHRLMTTRQLHHLLQPHVTTPVYLRRELARLRALGLADFTLRNRGGGQGEHAWYCTAAGADVAEAGGEVTVRVFRMTEQAAASQLQEHTLAVNDTGLAFVRAARIAGHGCGPLDWEPELSHRYRDGESRTGDDAFLIPDAVLRYDHRGPGGRATFLTLFLEIDRATMSPVRLLDKLRAYGRYQSYIPAATGRPGARPASTTEAWKSRYGVFPPVLFVFAAGARGSARALVRRTADVRALAAGDGRLRRVAGRLRAGVTTLEQLQGPGPWAPVVVPVFGEDPAPVDVLTWARHADGA